ncbi:MAG: phosphoribosylanthranilate isomerase [Gemmatimonadales bacterium]|nr:phosphoribosylanthranilate isomerase [Gemmatimonadales bacterium]
MAVEAKVCGLTRPEDVRAAADAGATYLGIVLAASPREVTPAHAADLVRAAGTTPVFAVFGAATAQDILSLRDRVQFGGAQLHGPHAAEDAALLRREGLVVWRVLRLAGRADLDRLVSMGESADAVLVEPWVPGAGGGTGTALAIELAQEARERLKGRRMVLAGGLVPETVARTVALVRPDVVDVSSGVEIRPGVKHAARISRFMEALLEHSAAR